MPASLADPRLAPLWRAARRRLDLDGGTAARSIAMPSVDPGCSLTLTALLGRPPAARADLRTLEDCLRRLGVGRDLEAALTRLGFPRDASVAAARDNRARTRRAHAAVAECVADWPEPWAAEWALELRTAGLTSGLDANEVTSLVGGVRRLLDWQHQHQPRARSAGRHDRQPSSEFERRFGSESDASFERQPGDECGCRPDNGSERRPGNQPDHELEHRFSNQPDDEPGRDATERPGCRSAAAVGRRLGEQTRAQVAARLFGSAHALDDGTKLASAAKRALRHFVGSRHPTPQGRQLWEAAGIAVDAVSAPVLTWGLRPLGSSPAAQMLAGAADAELPLHLSLRLLREHSVEVSAGTRILVVENPSVVEAAIAGGLRFGLVCTNGNPSTAVTVLLDQLGSSGAALGYHGDFDSEGLAICGRMLERGCVPWMMDASDYVAAVGRADSEGVPLQRDDRGCGPTAWDSRLAAEFDARRLIVHEEFVAAEFLGAFGS